MNVSARDILLGLVAMVFVATAIGCVALAITYAGRRDIVTTQRAACQNTISDRLDTIDVRRMQARSAQAIADDSFQSAKTREVRAAEARVLRRSVRQLTRRVGPDHGGRLVCDQAFPAARFLP